MMKKMKKSKTAEVVKQTSRAAQKPAAKSRGRQRSQSSENQLLMSMLFGPKLAAELPAKWTEWKEVDGSDVMVSAREVYQRMLAAGIAMAKKR